MKAMKRLLSVSLEAMRMRCRRGVKIVKCLAMMALGGTLLLLASDGKAHQPHDNISAIAVSPAYDSDGTVFASLSHTFPFLLKTTDEGATWAPSQAGLPYGTVSSIAVSPDFAQDGVVFVGTVTPLPDEEGFVFKSTDEGTTWEAASSGLPGSEILSLAASPNFAADQTLFAGTAGDGVFVTSDAGASWNALNPGALDLMINEIAVSPDFAVDQTVFAGTSSGLLKSTDGGQTWTSILAQGAVEGLALSPAYSLDQTVFVGISGGGILRSQNGGATWQPRNNGLSDLAVTGLAISPDYAVDRTLLASTANTVFRTSDDGDLWTPQTEGLASQSSGQTGIHYTGFDFSPTFGQDRTVFLASFEGAHRSEDGADSWRHLETFSQKILRGLDVSPDFASDQTVFVGTYGGGAYRSLDGGDNWAAIDSGMLNMFLHPVAVSPNFASDHVVFAGHGGFLAKSTSRGQFWTSLNGSTQGFFFPRRLAFSPDFAVDRTLFLADDLQSLNPLSKSTDGGNSFVPVVVPVPVVRGIALSPDFGADQTLFIGTGLTDDLSSEIYRSQDGGDSWEPLLDGPGVLSIVVSPSFETDGTVFAGTVDSGVLKSTDGGDSWATVNTGFEPVVTIESLAISPAFPVDQTVFAGTRTRGVYKSTDGGQTWTGAGLQGDHIPVMAVSPNFAVDQTLFTGGWEGTSRSTDGGATWSRVLDVRRVDNENVFITRDQSWGKIGCQLCSGPNFMAAGSALARTELIFVGESITWIGIRAPFAGIANVYIDDLLETQVDLYSPQFAFQQVLFRKTNLSAGEHKLSIEVSGIKNPASANVFVLLDALDIGY
jgi:photosystem II stability/assembly factor-like uncharacterized protein